MKRQFKHTSTRNVSLADNAAHKFALSRTMKIFGSNTAYTFIPKNACSTMRLSVAIANGCIRDASQIAWIHDNNFSFPLTTESAFLADYTFTILRSPFRRVYAAFFDKLVDMDTPVWQMLKASRSPIHPHDLTFRQFIDILSRTPHGAMNHHWRPQVDFLLYENYDDYFCVEEFNAFSTEIHRKIGLEIFDSRPFLKHSISDLEPVQMDGADDLTALELLTLKKKGRVPSLKSVLTNDIEEKLNNIYKGDIDLYRQIFPHVELN